MSLHGKSTYGLFSNTLGISLLAVFLSGCLSGGGGSGSSAASGAGCMTPLDESADPLTALTCQGTFAGTSEGGMHAFRGIRYGEAERFAAPMLSPAHEGVVQLNDFGDSCAQPETTFGQPSTTEDCLFLNVYGPEEPGDYPVMVWIHGGALLGGQGGAEYEPQRLVAQGIVVVTLNYRLGALGFLPHSDLEESNLGLQDQQLALQWIQQNIRAFDGDPDNVTIFGESAGGHSVLSHIVSPTAAGLFHRAIVQSGSYNGDQLPLNDVPDLDLLGGETLIGDPIVQRIRQKAPEICTDETPLQDCLRQVDLEVILASQSEVLAERKIESVLPVSQTPLLPVSINAALRSGDFNRVPVMMGSNLDEGDLFMLVAVTNDLIAFYNEGNYRSTVASLIKQNRLLDSDTIATDYLALARDQIANNPQRQAELASAPPIIGMIYPYLYAYSLIVTDWRFACPNDRQWTLLQDKVDTYGYWFTDRQSASISPLSQLTYIPLGAGHAFELPFLLNSAETLLDKGASEAQQIFADRLVEYWSNFAKYGDPNSTDGSAVAVEWPRYGIEANIIKLKSDGSESVAVSEYRAVHNCAYWEAPPLIAE